MKKESKAELSREDKIAHHMKEIISLLGEDVKREGLERTPMRYAKAMTFLTKGYHETAQGVIGQGIFKGESSEIVLVRDIELYSLCEHHLLPFHGKAHVAYIPGKKIVGLSKIPRIVDMFARRLQVQERMTNQIAETLMKELKAEGVAVIIEAYHLCMMMRGVQKQNSKTITSCMLGAFSKQETTRKELLHLLNGFSLK